jgi:prepilin-type N-terminal cleavage/methylation domain-containing protein
MKPRRAFTLPEVLLAVLLFSVGILGLASTATFVAEQIGDARQMVAAAHFVRSQLDSLRAVPCASVVAGSAAMRGASMTWSVSVAPRARTLRAVLALAVWRGTRTRAIDALLQCDS